MREEHLLHVRRRISDMNHVRAAWPHQKRRLFDGVMSDRNDEIGMIHGPVHVVARRKGRRTHVVIGAAGDGAFAHLRIEEWNAGALHEARQLLDEPGTIAGRPDHDQRPLRLVNHLCRAGDRFRIRDWPLDRMCRHDRHIANFVGGDVLRQFQEHRTWPLFLRNAERIAHNGRDASGAHDLPRHLGQRLHRGDHVDDLKFGLLAGHDRLLPRQQDHRHRAELCISSGGRKIERARSQRGDADARTTGEPAMGGRHEARGLLVPRQHELNARPPQ